MVNGYELKYGSTMGFVIFTRGSLFFAFPVHKKLPTDSTN